MIHFSRQLLDSGRFVAKGSEASPPKLFIIYLFFCKALSTTESSSALTKIKLIKSQNIPKIANAVWFHSLLSKNECNAAAKYDAIKQDNNKKYEINQVTRWPQPDHTNQKEQNYHDYHDYYITHLNCILFFIWIVCKDRIGGFVHT